MSARGKLLLLACVGVLAVCLDRPLALGLLCGVCLLPALGLRLPGHWWRRGLGAVAVVVWGTALSQGIFYSALPREPLVALGPLVIWKQGVVWGLVQSLRFVATILAGVTVAVSTPPDRLHAALISFRLPPTLSFLAATALRLLPDTAATWIAVRAARRERGRAAWRRSPWAWLRLEVAMLRPVVAEALRRARALAESLDARGYDPAVPRRIAPGERSSRLVLLVVVVATLAVALSRVLFALYAAEVFYAPALRPLYGFVRAWL